MKNRHLLILCLALLGPALPGRAKISDETFNAKETPTAGQIFQNQADAVSLYLTTERIVYVPEISNDNHLEVSVTLLGKSFGDDRAGMQAYVLRRIQTFNKTLVKRLEKQVPKLAEEFNAGEDVTFRIREGAQGLPVATWTGGVWTWANSGRQETLKAKRVSKKIPANLDEKKRKCPALIGAAK